MFKETYRNRKNVPKVLLDTSYWQNSEIMIGRYVNKNITGKSLTKSGN